MKAQKKILKYFWARTGINPKYDPNYILNKVVENKLVIFRTHITKTIVKAKIILCVATSLLVSIFLNQKKL